VPDVVALIKSQHRQLEQLLEQAEQEDTDILDLLRQVSAMLTPHSEAEESYVYPRIAELQPDEAEETHDGAAEHHHAEALLNELLAGDPDEPGYDGKLAALVGELHHHIEEEESELLTVLSDKASDDEREQLGARFAADTGQAGVTVAADASKSELYEQAKEADVPGRSSMTKDELAQAISEKG
jgi:hemerythrin-like domain-containing protein